MESPEEIKKALQCRSNLWYCILHDCTYYRDKISMCSQDVARDALDYIQQLEKERNALLADLRDADMLECDHCAHYIPVGAQCKGEGDCLDCDYKNCACNGCYGNSNWKWRGVQEVEHVREF